MPDYRIKPGGMHDRFHKSRRKIQVIGGGFGNGKTAAACIKAITLAKAYPGSNGLVAMATYAQLNDTIRKEFYKWMPASAVKRYPTISDNTMILKNGSQINFRYIQQKGKAAAADGQTSSNLLSATYDWAVVDQIENPSITYKDFMDLLGRLRGSTPYRGADDSMPRSGPRWLILTANPSFNWVFHKLIKPYEVYKANLKSWQESHPDTTVVDYSEIPMHEDMIVDTETNEPLIEIFEAATYENAHNLEPDFIKSLEAAYKGQFRDRYLGGEWGAFEGLVYSSFKPQLHLVPKHRIMAHLFNLSYQNLKPESVEGFDFGIASPSCYLFGFHDYRGRVFILDGFYEKEMILQRIGNRMTAIQQEYYPHVDIRFPILADPSIFKRTITLGQGTGADTVKSVLVDNYKQLSFKPGQNDILNGIAKVSSYLSVDNFPHFETNEPNGPLIYIADHLTFIVDEFLSYFWKMTQGFERSDTPIDRNDHAMDTIKYMFSYLPDAVELMFNFSQQLGEGQWNQRIQQS